MLPPIKGFIENTLLDWEGVLAGVVFVPGCNYRCGYCHARHLLEPDPGDESIPVQSILANLRRQKGWVDGIVISGGEPTLHPGIFELAQEFKKARVGVKLDTNGSRPDVLERLLKAGMVDYVAMDVKAPLDERYSRVAGVHVDLDTLRESINMLVAGQTPYEFRTTVCPGLLDGDDVEAIGEAIEGASRYYLQAFRPINCLDRELEETKPYNGEEMRELCRRAAPYVRRCMVRGDQASELVAGEVAKS